MELSRCYHIEECVSKDKTLVSLQSIRMEKRKLVATDGHILAVVPYVREKEDSATFVIPEIVKAGRKLTKRGPIEIKNLNGQATLSNGTIMSNTRGDESPFPKYLPIVKDALKAKKVYRIGLNVDLLKQLADGIGATKVCLEFQENRKAAIVVRPNDEHENREAYGILMPVGIPD